MSKTIQFVLDGCDISFIAEAPEDITLKQLLTQCDKIKPHWCACGIRSVEKAFPIIKVKTEIKVETEILIGYDTIKKLDKDAPCSIEGGETE